MAAPDRIRLTGLLRESPAQAGLFYCAERHNPLVPEPFDTRRATVADLDAILAIVQSGFDSYGEFMHEDWRPPDAFAGREGNAEILAQEGTWALLALADRKPIGHVAFTPARERSEGEPPGWSKRRPIPGLAHLWQLFVLPEWWGRGVAPALHGAAVAEMRARGYERARLFTPSASPRARRFYERRGWRPVGEEWFEPLAMLCTEYRLGLKR
jgi:GNAT superfamily N-acetyltransferase